MPKLDNDLVTGTLTPEKLTMAGGYRYLNARKPELYRDIIGQEHKSVQKVAWMEAERQKKQDKRQKIKVKSPKTARPQDRKTARLQDRKTARPQDRKTTRLQDCKTARPQDNI